MLAKRSVLLLSLSVITLLVIGFVMLASASFYTAKGQVDDYSMVIRQGVSLLASLGVCMALAMMNYERLLRWRWYLFGLAVITLILCYVPGVGVEKNGAKRWIGLQSLGMEGARVQPSEFAKMVLVIVLAAWFAKHEQCARTFGKGFVVPTVLLFLVAGLIGGEMDLGSATITAFLGMGMMVVAGTRLRFMPLIGVVTLGALAVMVWITPNRMYRVYGFASELPVISQYIDLSKLPEKEQKEIAAKKRQQQHAALAFGSGSVGGVGPGQGRVKMYSLAEAQTDFILPLVGEELGLRGTLVAVFAFVMIVICGMCIAAYAPNRFGKLLGFGLTLLIGLEGLMNMGVTTGVFPNKGLPLPFVSYGGSSLFVAMASIGILINIHRQGVHLNQADLPVIRRKNRWTPQV